MSTGSVPYIRLLLHVGGSRVASMEGLAQSFGPIVLWTLLGLWPPEQVALGLQGPRYRVVACSPCPAPFRARPGLSPAPPPVLSQQWIERVVGWLGKVFLQDGPARPASPEASSTLRRWRCHVQRFFYRVYASLRIEELFSIIRGGCPRPAPRAVLSRAERAPPSA